MWIIKEKRIMELYFIIEADKESNLFFCDKDLSRFSVFDKDFYFNRGHHPYEYFNCYLLTKDEIDAIIEKLGDKAICHSEYNYEDSDVILCYYNIFPMSKDFWINDLQDEFYDFWFSNCDGDKEDKAYEEWWDYCEDFEKTMSNKYNCSYYENYLLGAALERTRIYPEFIKAYMKINIEDATNYWRENVKPKE